MRAAGKRSHSASASVGDSDSAPNRKTFRSGRVAALKAGLSNCWRTNDGVDAHIVTRWRAR